MSPSVLKLACNAGFQVTQHGPPHYDSILDLWLSLMYGICLDVLLDCQALTSAYQQVEIRPSMPTDVVIDPSVSAKCRDSSKAGYVWQKYVVKQHVQPIVYICVVDEQRPGQKLYTKLHANGLLISTIYI